MSDNTLRKILTVKDLQYNKTYIFMGATGNYDSNKLVGQGLFEEGVSIQIVNNSTCLDVILNSSTVTDYVIPAGASKIIPVDLEDELILTADVMSGMYWLDIQNDYIGGPEFSDHPTYVDECFIYDYSDGTTITINDVSHEEPLEIYARDKDDGVEVEVFFPDGYAFLRTTVTAQVDLYTSSDNDTADIICAVPRGQDSATAYLPINNWFGDDADYPDIGAFRVVSITQPRQSSQKFEDPYIDTEWLSIITPIRTIYVYLDGYDITGDYIRIDYTVRSEDGRPFNITSPIQLDVCVDVAYEYDGNPMLDSVDGVYTIPSGYLDADDMSEYSFEALVPISYGPALSDGWGVTVGDAYVNASWAPGASDEDQNHYELISL